MKTSHMSYKTICLIGFAVSVCSSRPYAQVAIGTNEPHASAKFQVDATDKGVLIPRMTAEQRTGISGPVAGLLVFQTDARVGFHYYTGAAWIRLMAEGVASLDGLVDAKSGGSQFSNSLLIGHRNTDNLINSEGNTGIGFDALSSITEAYYNTSLGFESMMANTTGGSNAAVGFRALAANTSGMNNVAVGNETMGANTEGFFNTAVGFQSMLYNTTGSSNVAVGRSSANKNTTGLYNVAVGDAALYENQESSYNIAIGANALSAYNGDFGGNTAIGSDALSRNSTGSFNTAIGYKAGDLGSTYDNTTAIGYNAQVNGSDQIQLGNSATTVYVYGTVQNRSDGRDKKDIRDTELGLDFIMSLRPVDFRYDYREDYESSHPDSTFTHGVNDGSKKRDEYSHGFIAQEVEEVLQERGYDFGGVNNVGAKGGKDVYYMGYNQFIAPLTKAVQEQQRVIESQQRQIDELKGLVQQMTGRKSKRR